MQNLENRLKRKIQIDGPLRFDAFMGLCLSLPEQGYYQKAPAIGGAEAKGDFITAPEISQIFGEMVGLWILQNWIAWGEPDAINLVEFGPGRGTLMSDALRICEQVKPAFNRAKQLYLLEQNTTLRAIQSEALKEHDPKWVPDLSKLPQDAPFICVVNEFFDALPIRLFRAENTQWAEMHVGLCEQSENFRFVAHKISTAQQSALQLPDALQNGWYELGQQGIQFLTDLLNHLKPNGGCLLALDYGYAAPDLNRLSVQAIQSHRIVELFHQVGQTDLSAHVDFGKLEALAIENRCYTGLTSQAEFLTAMGGEQRLKQLQKAADSPAKSLQLESGYKRLVDPNQMGELFKALTLWSS